MCVFLFSFCSVFRGFKRCCRSRESSIRGLLSIWNGSFVLQKLQPDWFRSRLRASKPKGREPVLVSGLWLAAIVLFERQSACCLRYIHHRASGSRWKCEASLRGSWRILLVFYYSVLKRHQEKSPLIFFFFWHLLNFCPAPAGGPPCQCGFHGDAVNAGSENRLLELERGGRSSGSLHRLSSFFAASAAAWMFSAS